MNSTGMLLRTVKQRTSERSGMKNMVNFSSNKCKLIYHCGALTHCIGPVVRINPNEVHITAPAAYNEIYLKTKPVFNKYYPFYRMFLADSASIGIMDNHAHRARRELLTPLFSRPNVIEMEHIIWRTVYNLCDKFRAYAPASGQPQSGKKLGTKVLFKMLTSDIISDFCYGKSFESLEKVEIKTDEAGVDKAVPPRFIRAMAGAAEGFWFMQKFWRLQLFLVNLPDWIVDTFHIEASLGMRDLMNVCAKAMRSWALSLEA